MTKIFLTAISLQGSGDLEKGIYQPEGFSLIARRVRGLDIIGSLDRPVSDAAEGNDSAREIPDTENAVEAWEEENDRKAFWDIFAENFVDRWQEVEAAAGVANRR